MRPFEAEAVLGVRRRARETEASDRQTIERLIAEAAPGMADAELLAARILSCRDVTLNFHPDRFAANGKTVLENLLRDGLYQSQFVTGTSNGGRTAYPNGDRDVWEQRMFAGAYHCGELTYPYRPKYGALNLLNYADGASARFGACFLTLKPRALNRCTFAYGDSSASPDTLGTADSFYGIVRAILSDVLKRRKLLNKPCGGVNEAIAYIASLEQSAPCEIGRNMDDCVETHVHGDIRLAEDVACFFLDGSYRKTEIERQAEALCGRYGIQLRWIPERRIRAEVIGNEFRGPAVPVLARKIVEKYSFADGHINAERIGRASRDSMMRPEEWADLGNEGEVFQFIKQLWHTVAVWG